MEGNDTTKDAIITGEDKKEKMMLQRTPYSPVNTGEHHCLWRWGHALNVHDDFNSVYHRLLPRVKRLHREESYICMTHEIYQSIVSFTRGIVIQKITGISKVSFNNYLILEYRHLLENRNVTLTWDICFDSSHIIYWHNYTYIYMYYVIQL